MQYLILILIALAFLHFIYEGIIAPSLRLKLRFELFETRDALRQMKIEEPDKAPDDIFRPLENGLNNSIKLLARTDLATVISINQKISNDPKLELQNQKLWEHLQEALNEETKPIFDRCFKLFMLTLLVNNGMLVLYFLPFAIVLMLCALFGVMTSSVLRKLMAVVFMPENQVANLLPSDQLITV